MRDTVGTGDISVAMLMAAFLRGGFIVLTPFSDGMRYDVVIDRGSGFERVQCKTGRIRNGSIRFNACSSTVHWGGVTRDYRGQIELFGVYCPDNDQCYLIPVDQVGTRQGVLRVEPARNGQQAKTRSADDFRITALR